MTQSHTIGGRRFLEIDEGTLEHDLAFVETVNAAGIDRFALEPGEDPEAFARRVTRAIAGSGRMLDLLGMMLLPAELMQDAPAGAKPGDLWTRATQAEVSGFLARVTTRTDKDRVHVLAVTLLVQLFAAGIVSLRRIVPFSDLAAMRAGEIGGPIPAASARGPR